jgi:hypothetical protein
LIFCFIASGFLSPSACLLRFASLLAFFATLAFGVLATLALLRMASEAKKAFG